ncbi:hypothetical protein [Spirosoma jeollabukense]
MNNRTLGTFGLAGAPAFLLSMLLPVLYPGLAKTAFDGLSGFVFMLTWMASLVGLIRLNATGNSFFGRFIIRANLVTLTLANFWNIYQAIQPWANTRLYWFLDAFWPISMLTMLLVGITIARVGRLQSWKRYVPLAVGLWLPITALTSSLAGLPMFAGPAQQFDSKFYTMLFSGLYSAVCWGLMAYVVRSTVEYKPTEVIS